MHCRTALLAVALTTATLTASGCGILMRYVGEGAAFLITQKTADLAEVSAQAQFITNLYPADAATVEVQALEQVWVKGGNLVGINFLKRRGIGMWEIEGTVTARKAGGPAEPMTYLGKGAYVLLLQPGDRAPRTIEVRTATGQTASFPVKPAAGVAIKAVNGKPAGASVDPTRDLVIDLADPGKGRLKVMLAASPLGIRTMTDLAICAPAKRLVIPAAAFKHMGVTASAAGIVGVDAGANYVVVERYEGGTSPRPGVGAAFTMAKSWAHAPVTVTGDIKNAAPLALSGELANPRGKMSYSFNKGQAFYAPPLSRVKKAAIGSLVVRGTLFKQKTSTSESYGLGVKTITTTTTTWAFPKVAPAAWDRLAEDAAAGLQRVTGELGGRATFVPVERVTGSPIYREMEEVQETAGEKFVEKTYRGTRKVFPESFAAVIGGVSSTFALDRPHVRLLNAVGADALLSARLELEIGTWKDTEKLALVPKLSYTLVGPANGYTVGPTTYVSGWVAAADGVPFSKEMLGDVGALRKVVRLDDLLAGLRASLTRVRAEERKAGYEAIWALQ